MNTPHRRTTDRPREHLHNARPLAFILIATVAAYCGVALAAWLS